MTNGQPGDVVLVELVERIVKMRVDILAGYEAAETREDTDRVSQAQWEMGGLAEDAWRTPAHTAEGVRAKTRLLRSAKAFMPDGYTTQLGWDDDEGRFTDAMGFSKFIQDFADDVERLIEGGLS